MDNRSILVLLFLVFLFFAQNLMLSLGMICKDNEREALLSIKQDLKDYYNSLSSWSRENENCCRWAGVECDNVTDHVVLLLVQGPWLEGKLNPSLQELKQLRHLDLSFNNFEGSIPDFLGSLRNLRHLELRRAGFSGMIPHQLGNLSNLRYLDIGPIIVDGNYEWLSHLSFLQYLRLSGVNLKNASYSVQAISMLPSLLSLHLSDCALDALPSFLYGNVTSLAVLDLSENNLNSILPESLYRLTNLERLDLRANSFQGTISDSIGNLTKLTILDLSGNQFSGSLPHELGRLQNLDHLSLRGNIFSRSIPFSIGRLTLLSSLDLSYNELNGTVPESLGNLSKLETLYLSYNALEVIVSDIMFSNLTRLSRIELDSVVLKVSPEWKPPFQLRYAYLSNCGLGPRFPNWIQTQKNLSVLDLSSNGISGTVPTWLWNLSSQFSYLNLSHNHFNGELPKMLKGNDSLWIDIYLSSNKFEGPLPRLGLGIETLDLSNNSISGPISALLCNPFNEANELKAALIGLDLSNNLLSGNLSQCWVYWTSLRLIWLDNNKITGKIPSSIGSLHQLESLHLQNNNLSDELPLDLRNCTLLKTLDIGENVLTGRLPIWLGESLPDLIVLRLRLNKFHGEIPQNLCHMTSLQMLDLAHNNLSGSIPRCFNNFTAMVTEQNSSWSITDFAILFSEYVETVSLVTKGREFEFSKTLRLVTSMDLSKNHLSGKIPEELASLIGLRFLNLSENHFTGKIPENIGDMSLLESLDFSNNNISGVIPQSISGISSLSHLNLSYNNLSGKIPLSTQLQSFNESSFIGNQELCGLPLKKCSEENPPQKPGDKEVEDEDWFEMKWFYISTGVGLVVGFWTFWGVIVLNKSWRIAYFRFLDDMKDKLCLLF